jgi:hypothetical protein
MYNTDSSSPVVTNCAFKGNTTNLGDGGGMCNRANSSPIVTSCMFEGNSAKFGGGMYNDESPLSISNCIFEGNHADSGAGMVNDNASLTVTNCTLSGNRARDGGGGISLYLGYDFDGEATIRNSVIWGNGPTGEDTKIDLNRVTDLNVQNSNLGGCGGSSAWNDTCGVDGGGNIDEDPLLLDIAAGQLYPRAGSPCIDTGDNTLLDSDAVDLDGDGDTSERLSLDIAAESRQSDGNGDGTETVDMGAYEFQSDEMPNVDPADTRIRYVNSDVTTPGDGTTWDNSFATVQTAIDACRWVAVVLDEQCEVWVAEGEYTPPDPVGDPATILLRPAVAVYGGFSGTETALEERDWETNETVLNGNGIASPVVKGADNATLDGFTITGGQEGGMLNLFSSPTVANCKFTDNASAAGGGMYNYYSSPTVSNCTFKENASNRGGGMMNGRECAPTVTNCTFEGNSAEYLGGGMYNSQYSDPLVSNCVFRENAAGHGGGGMYNDENSPLVMNCLFEGNASESRGGGMYNDSSSAILVNCTFEGNAAEYVGGAIYSEYSNTAVTNCVLADNTAVDGGGMYNNESAPTLTNCTLVGNAAENGGGGMHNYGEAYPMIQNSIIWGNTASPTDFEIVNEQKIDEYCDGDPDMEDYCEYFYYPPNPTFENCDIGMSGGSIAWILPFSKDLGGNIDSDPLYAEAEVDNFSLLSDSPCIDTGNNALLPSDHADLDSDTDTEETLPSDRSGALRTVGAAVDMGAFEFQP